MVKVLDSGPRIYTKFGLLVLCEMFFPKFKLNCFHQRVYSAHTSCRQKQGIQFFYERPLLLSDKKCLVFALTKRMNLHKESLKMCRNYNWNRD